MTRVLVALLLAFSGLSVAQEAQRLPVHLFEQCSNDSVGQRIAFKLREGLRSSSAMTLANSYGDSLVQLSLVCLDPDPENNGRFSHYAYAITFMNTKGHYDYHLTHGLGSCGTRRVDECAEDLVADIDSAIVDLKRRIQSGEFKPFDP